MLKKTIHKLHKRGAVRIGARVSFSVLLTVLIGLGSGCGKKTNQVILPKDGKETPSDNGDNNTTEELDKGPFTTLEVKPSTTNPAITYWDDNHVVKYNPAIENNKIVLWLTGTGGKPARNTLPDLFGTILERKYRIINLSYLSEPPGTQICGGAKLYANCYEDFRQIRAYGDFSGVKNATKEAMPDESHDAIVFRFAKLLQYLAANDPQGKWGNYLNGEEPRWDKICIVGQSMGGGMGLYIAKTKKVDKVISFSGGWDVKSTNPKTIADWYARPGLTPGSRLYGVYHVQESEAATLAQLYPACGIPEKQIYRLSKTLRSNVNPNAANPYHGEGILNTVYKPIWEAMLGFGI